MSTMPRPPYIGVLQKPKLQHQEQAKEYCRRDVTFEYQTVDLDAFERLNVQFLTEYMRLIMESSLHCRLTLLLHKQV